MKLIELGYDMDDEPLANIFLRFKAVAEQKKQVTDVDIRALVSDEVFQPAVVWKLHDLQVSCGTLGLSPATVKLIDADGMEYIACSVGTGPVDSVYKAVDLIVKVPAELLEYSMTAVTEGIDAITTTQVLIRGKDNRSSMHALTGESIPRTFSCTGASMDIVVYIVKAYVGALNKTLGFLEKPTSEVSSSAAKMPILA